MGTMVPYEVPLQTSPQGKMCSKSIEFEISVETKENKRRDMGLTVEVLKKYLSLKCMCAMGGGSSSTCGWCMPISP